jgi:Leucine-rich repeat (LRR) protein
LDLSNNLDLQYLTASDSQLASINLTGLTALTQIEVNNNLITSLDVSTNTALQSLSVYDNLLTHLDISNNTALNSVSASNNSLSTINLDGASSLNGLYIDNNQFTSFEITFATPLEHLQIFDNQLSNLNLSGAVNLITLDANNNQIPSINLSPLVNLSSINFNDNALSSLDISNIPNLYYIYANNNNIANLNLTNATTLNWLELNQNALTNFDASSCPNLNYLYVNNNQLTSLTGLHSNISKLDCSYNLFTTLDFSALTTLGNYFADELLFHDNPNLEYINFKNGNNHNYDWSMALTNFNLNTLPLVEAICVDDINSYFVQDIESVATQDIIFTEYCSFTPGGAYYTITGNTIFDSDNNGCDVADLSYPNLTFQISDGNTTGAFYSTESGSYTMPIQEGNYTITPLLENEAYFSISPATLNVNFPADASPYTQDFCITPNGVHDDLELFIVPIEAARPGFDTDYKLIFKNKGNTTLSGNIEFTFDDNYMDLLSSTPIVDTQSNGFLTWNYSNLQPFETREISFTMVLNTPTDGTYPLNGGDYLNYSATINPTTSDETPDDNTSTLDQEVVNSYDPNDKTCLEGETVTPSQVGKFVHYLIRFENTGSASAVNVVIKDVIDTTKYDLFSLVPLNASHAYQTRIRNENEVEFIFENIQLPFDDANNDGYVLFKIKTLETLSLGDSFSNEANIFFDYNAPIITNNETTIIQENLSLTEFALSNIKVYPNPTADQFKIENLNTLNVKSIELYDLSGKRLKEFSISEGYDIKELTSGIYFISIKTEDTATNIKLIKQ